MARSAQLAVAAVLVALLVAAPAANAVTCNEVVFMMSHCLTYAVGRDPIISESCCDGVRSLHNAAHSKEDCQTACNCLEEYLGRIGNLRPNLVGVLPSMCRVWLPYAMSPSADCINVYGE